MKNAELKVIRFGANDVIATSGECPNTTEYHFKCDSVAGIIVNGCCYYYENDTWNSEGLDSLSYYQFATTPEAEKWYYFSYDEQCWYLCDNTHNTQ